MIYTYKTFLDICVYKLTLIYLSIHVLYIYIYICIYIYIHFHMSLCNIFINNNMFFGTRAPGTCFVLLAELRKPFGRSPYLLLVFGKQRTCSMCSKMFRVFEY